ncbi:MAG TPA: polysaccharide biosynthesis tyrosine autokinase [Thermoleophilaceae bacterium]|nr:polysaccharide biosynthesis tyrosine autokinase [Thermoleophilaceae bacterium]
MNPNDAGPAAEGGLTGLIRTLRRRWIVVLIPALLVPCIAAAYALSREDEYAATASLLFRSTPGSEFRLSEAQDEEREGATNQSLASLNEVSQRTAAALGNGVTAGTVAGSVETTAAGTANLLTIKATNPDQGLVARIANEYAEQFVAFRRDADRRTVGEAQRRSQRRINEVQRRLTTLRAQGDQSGAVGGEIRSLVGERNQLEDEARKLATLETLTSGNVEIAQRASTPGAPSTPGPLPTTLLGLGLGILLGIGLALLFEMLDRRMRDTKDIERAFNRPTLGAIPLSPALARGRRKQIPVRGKARSLGPGEMEAFHMLRANLRYFEADRAVKSVVVTSAAPGEGKSTVAWNLAAANANAGNRVLLIEAELRRPTFVREFKLKSSRGLIHILADGADPADVVTRLPVSANPTNGDGPHGEMDVIAAGGIPPNPTDLLDSERMLNLIRTAEQEYDLVVIDTPPVSVVSDAIPILKATDGVIVVSLIGVSSRDAAGHLRKQLESLGVHFLGVVINGISSSDGYYGTVYGYAERYEAAGQPAGG